MILTLFHNVIPLRAERSPMYTIREAETARDIAQVRELFLEYQSTLGVDLCFQGFAEELASLPGHYARPAGRLLLASNGPAVLGVVALRPILGTDCEMKRLYVRSLGRGAGLGRLLTRALVKEARLAGYSRVLLDTLPTMTEAQALYRSMGFVEISAYRHNPVAGTRYMALDLRKDEPA
jgi:putative acetyltransferase